MRLVFQGCFCLLLCFLTSSLYATGNRGDKKINTALDGNVFPKARLLVQNLNEQSLNILAFKNQNVQINLYINSIGVMLLAVAGIGLMALFLYHQQIMNAKENMILEQKHNNHKNDALNIGYAIGHDLKTPVQNIRLLLEKFLAKNQAQLDEESKLNLLRVNSLTRVASELIDVTLKFAELDQIPINPVIFQTSRIVANLCQSLQELNPEKNIVFRLENLPDQMGDPLMLRQVFANLLQNAVKFSSDRHPIRIDVYSSEHRQYREFFVRDNGCGFPENATTKIFEPFKSAHDRTIFPGHGIGLAMVKRIIERHGGTVWAENNPDGGAIFGFRLPL